MLLRQSIGSQCATDISDLQTDCHHQLTVDRDLIDHANEATRIAPASADDLPNLIEDGFSLKSNLSTLIT